MGQGSSCLGLGHNARVGSDLAQQAQQNKTFAGAGQEQRGVNGASANAHAARKRPGEPWVSTGTAHQGGGVPPSSSPSSMRKFAGALLASGNARSPRDSSDWLGNSAVVALVLGTKRLAAMPSAALDAAAPCLVYLGPSLSSKPSSRSNSTAAADSQSDAYIRRAVQAAVAVAGHGAAATLEATPMVFLRVIPGDAASGTQHGGGGFDISDGQQQESACTGAQRLRYLLDSCPHAREAVRQAACEWRHGSVSVVQDVGSALLGGILRIRAAYQEEDDGHLHPALLLQWEQGAGGPPRAPRDQPGSLYDNQQLMLLQQQGSGQVAVLPTPASVLHHSRDAASGQLALQAFAEGNLLGTAQVNQASLLRSLAILGSVPMMATLLQVDGGAVFQNELSVSYWGDLSDSNSQPGSVRHGHHSRHSLLAGRRTADILAALLALKPEAMDEVMASIQNKEPRRLVLQVPVTCNPSSHDEASGDLMDSLIGMAEVLESAFGAAVQPIASSSSTSHSVVIEEVGEELGPVRGGGAAGGMEGGGSAGPSGLHCIMEGVARHLGTGMDGGTSAKAIHSNPGFSIRVEPSEEDELAAGSPRRAAYSDVQLSPPKAGEPPRSHLPSHLQGSPGAMRRMSRLAFVGSPSSTLQGDQLECSGLPCHASNVSHTHTAGSTAAAAAGSSTDPTGPVPGPGAGYDAMASAPALTLTSRMQSRQGGQGWHAPSSPLPQRGVGSSVPAPIIEFSEMTSDEQNAFDDGDGEEEDDTSRRLREMSASVGGGDASTSAQMRRLISRSAHSNTIKGSLDLERRQPQVSKRQLRHMASQDSVPRADTTVNALMRPKSGGAGGAAGSWGGHAPITLQSAASGSLAANTPTSVTSFHNVQQRRAFVVRQSMDLHRRPPTIASWHTEESSMAIQPSQKLRSLMAVHEAAHSSSSHTRDAAGDDTSKHSPIVRSVAQQPLNAPATKDTLLGGVTALRASSMSCSPPVSKNSLVGSFREAASASVSQMDSDIHAGLGATSGAMREAGSSGYSGRDAMRRQQFAGSRSVMAGSSGGAGGGLPPSTSLGAAIKTARVALLQQPHPSSSSPNLQLHAAPAALPSGPGMRASGDGTSPNLSPLRHVRSSSYGGGAGPDAASLIGDAASESTNAVAAALAASTPGAGPGPGSGPRVDPAGAAAAAGAGPGSGLGLARLAAMLKAPFHSALAVVPRAASASCAVPPAPPSGSARPVLRHAASSGGLAAAAALRNAAADEDDEDDDDEEEGSVMESEVLAWHEVDLLPLADPVTGQDMLLLLQMDISERAEKETRLNAVTETQLNMLEQMFPRHVLEYMIRAAGVGGSYAANQLANSHDGVTILFMDIVGFTTMSKEVHPAEVMGFLNSLFTLLDELIDQYEVYKVETAGDCYIVAGSLMSIDEEGFLALERHADALAGAEKVMAFAKAMLRCAKTVTMPHNGQPTQVRVGLHTGPVVTGLIGTKLPKFSIFGDTMNTASRMESTCRPGCIQVSETTRELLTSHTFTPTGGVEVKGKGLMSTYLWIPEDHPEEQYKSVKEQAQEATALLKHINNTLSWAPAASGSSAAAAGPPGSHPSAPVHQRSDTSLRSYKSQPSTQLSRQLSPRTDGLGSLLGPPPSPSPPQGAASSVGAGLGGTAAAPAGAAGGGAGSGFHHPQPTLPRPASSAYLDRLDEGDEGESVSARDLAGLAAAVIAGLSTAGGSVGGPVPEPQQSQSQLQPGSQRTSAASLFDLGSALMQHLQANMSRAAGRRSRRGSLLLSASATPSPPFLGALPSPSGDALHSELSVALAGLVQGRSTQAGGTQVPTSVRPLSSPAAVPTHGNGNGSGGVGPVAHPSLVNGGGQGQAYLQSTRNSTSASPPLGGSGNGGGSADPSVGFLTSAGVLIGSSASDNSAPVPHLLPPVVPSGGKGLAASAGVGRISPGAAGQALQPGQAGQAAQAGQAGQAGRLSPMSGTSARGSSHQGSLDGFVLGDSPRAGGSSTGTGAAAGAAAVAAVVAAPPDSPSVGSGTVSPVHSNPGAPATAAAGAGPGPSSSAAAAAAARKTKAHVRRRSSAMYGGTYGDMAKMLVTPPGAGAGLPVGGAGGGLPRGNDASLHWLLMRAQTGLERAGNGAAASDAGGGSATVSGSSNVVEGAAGAGAGQGTAAAAVATAAMTSAMQARMQGRMDRKRTTSRHALLSNLSRNLEESALSALPSPAVLTSGSLLNPAAAALTTALGSSSGTASGSLHADLTGNGLGQIGLGGGAGTGGAVGGGGAAPTRAAAFESAQRAQLAHLRDLLSRQMAPADGSSGRAGAGTAPQSPQAGQVVQQQRLGGGSQRPNPDFPGGPEAQP